jgi:hypothetical protein
MRLTGDAVTHTHDTAYADPNEIIFQSQSSVQVTGTCASEKTPAKIVRRGERHPGVDLADPLSSMGGPGVGFIALLCP